jgi:hypothetical protein
LNQNLRNEILGNVLGVRKSLRLKLLNDKIKESCHSRRQAAEKRLRNLELAREVDNEFRKRR